ncbi:MAG: hypothetical protein Q9218_005453 [Villophora microphyllina]
MNHANFQNMSAQGMPPQVGTQSAGPTYNGINMQQHILRALSQQPTPPGWQMSVPLQHRGAIIYQLHDAGKTLALASNFENKILVESTDKNAYDQSCRKKLAEIHDARTRHSASMQQQINTQMGVPQHMQNMPQNLTPQALSQQGYQNPQMQQMMQQHGLQMQQQQQQQQQQAGHQLHNMAMAQTQAGIPQTQIPPTEQLGRPVNQYTPTPEENQYISRLATQMISATPPQRIQAILNNLQQQMPPGQRETLARQGQDPLQIYFRSQAMKRFIDQKRAQAGNNAGSNVQAAGMMNGMPRPMPQTAGRPQGQQGPVPPQGFEPPFDQIFGQQQDGLRSQEAGQIVVPASNPQANLDQRNAAGVNPQHQMNVQNGANRALQNSNTSQPQSQTYWNAQRNINQPGPINGNTANMSNASQASSNVLQGQPGGLDNQITRTPSQTANMPNLNKAAVPPGQTPNIWQQRTPQPHQLKPQGTSMTPQATQQPMDRPNASQQQALWLRNMPVAVKQQLLSMPEDQRRPYLMELHQRHMRQQLEQQKLQQQTQQQSKMAGARAGVTDGLPMSSQASQPAMQARSIGQNPSQNPSMQPATMQTNIGQQPSGPQQISAYEGSARQQPVPGHKIQQQRGVSQVPVGAVNAPLTEEQTRQMDQRLFPAKILQSEALPQDVKTWGQLKDFAAKNTNKLPTGTLTKVQHLQTMQFHTQQHESQTSQPGANPAVIPQQQAPYAQMVSQPNVQASIPATRLPNGIQVPPPSYQEIQNMRSKLPPHQQGASDNDIRGFLIKSKQNALMKNMQAQQSQTPQMSNEMAQGHQVTQNQKHGFTGQTETAQPSRMGQSKASTQQTQKVSGATVNQPNKQGQPNRNAAQNKQPQKGVKRSSHEDVVEVPNPNLGTPKPQGHTSPSAQAVKQQPASQIPESKGLVGAKGSANDAGSAANQTDNTETQSNRPPGMPNISKEEIARRDVRLKQLMHEVGQSAPVRNIVPMTAEDKGQMTQRLRELAQMVSRMEMSFPTFFRNNPNEEITRQLIQTRNLIKAQYLDANFNVKEQLTITPEELNHAYGQIRSYFAYVMSKFGKRNNASQAGEQQPQKPSVNQEKAPLSAANLKKQQNTLQAERAAAMQRHHSGHGSRAPAAPTSDKPPFPLGPQSPHGIPLYGGASLTADQLVLPQPKRRKSNHNQPSAGSTPILVQETGMVKSSPLGPKVASPEAQRALVPQMSFKCSMADCQSGQRGFATQAELEQHNADAHAPEEPVVEDPFEFALESMRMALGLDENGKSKPQNETLEAPAMKASLSSSSNMAIKQETSTPMSRTGTQAGLSPSWQLLKTPQASSVGKNPAIDNAGKGVKRATTPAKESTPPPYDPWAGSSLSPEEIMSGWSSLADMQSLSFTKYQIGLTPSSTLSSSNEKNSPRFSDISENDAVKIDLDVGKNEKDNWIPSEWFDDVYGDMESLNMGRDTLMEDMGWDVFGDDPDADMADVDGGSDAKTKKRIEEEFGTSEEWLKVYAPEKLAAARKGR